MLLHPPPAQTAAGLRHLRAGQVGSTHAEIFLALDILFLLFGCLCICFAAGELSYFYLALHSAARYLHLRDTHFIIRVVRNRDRNFTILTTVDRNIYIQ